LALTSARIVSRNQGGTAKTLALERIIILFKGEVFFKKSKTVNFMDYSIRRAAKEDVEKIHRLILSFARKNRCYPQLPLFAG